MILSALQRLLLSMADTRADAEKEVTGTGKAIFKHMVVVLRYHDPVNLHKHLDDINTWLDSVQDITLKGNKRVKEKDYLQWLYLDRDHTEEDLTNYIRRLDRNYGTLLLRCPVDELLITLKVVYEHLAKELGQNKFVSIEDIFKHCGVHHEL